MTSTTGTTTGSAPARSELERMPGHELLGVGARFSVAVMAGDFADVIVGALADVDAGGLAEVVTDDVSTYVRGSELEVATYLCDVIAATAARAPGVHLSVQVLLSRGCPGSVVCELPDDLPLPEPDLVELAAIGVDASAHWALYPLGVSGHMPSIERAIDGARRLGTFVRVDHYATRLEGDVAAVLATAVNGWIEVGRDVEHVTSHLTMSIASPTAG